MPLMLVSQLASFLTTTMMLSRNITRILYPKSRQFIPTVRYGRAAIAANVPAAVAPSARTFSPASKADANTPLGTITSATDAIRSFTSQLKDLSLKISQDVTLVSGQSVTLRDIVLHCRDSPPSQFASAAAISARKEIGPLASEVEQVMSDMAQVFMTDVAPAMAKAASICQETPCGGALWELESEGKLNDGNVQEEFAGSDTPCGRLEAASQEFVELTNATREEIALGARAALLLRMSQEHNAPLVEVRKTKEGKEALARRFERELVKTPWLRPKEEYEQFKKMRKEQIRIT